MSDEYSGVVYGGSVGYDDGAASAPVSVSVDPLDIGSFSASAAPNAAAALINNGYQNAAAVLPSSVSDPNTGSESYNTIISVIPFSAEGAKFEPIASGTAAQLLAMWPSIIRYIDGFTQTTPQTEVVFVLPGNLLINFSPAANGETYPNADSAYNYLQRSAVVPTVAPAADGTVQTAVNNIYLQQLGQDADPGGLAYWTNLISNGQASLSDLQAQLAISPNVQTAMNSIWLNQTGAPMDPGSVTYWQQQFANGAGISTLMTTLATSSGPAAAMNYVWQSELGIPIDSGSLGTWQTIFANGGSIAQLQSALAYSSGVSTNINNLWISEIGVPVDQGSLNYWQSAFANGATLADFKYALAYSPGVSAAINAAYVNEVGYSVDSLSLNDWQAAFSSGGGTLAGLYYDLAYTSGAAAQINAAYVNETGSGADSATISAWQVDFAAGTATISSVQAALADQTVTATQINNAYINEVGSGADSGALSAWEQDFANGGSIADVVSALAPYAGTAISSIYSAMTGVAADSGSITAWEQQFAAGNATLANVKIDVAATSATAAAISDVYLSEAAISPDTASIAAWQQVFAIGSSTLAGVEAAVAATGAAAIAIANVYNSEFGQGPNSTQLDSAVSDFGQGAQDLSSLQQALAGSSESQTFYTYIVQQVLDRPATQMDLTTLQAAEAGGQGYQGAADALISSQEFAQDQANIVQINAQTIGNSSSPNFTAYESGNASSTNAGAILIPPDATSHLTSTTLTDDNGAPILGASSLSVPAQTPEAFSADFFLQRGHADASIFSGAVTAWNINNNPNAVTTDPISGFTTDPLANLGIELSLATSPLANFGQGHVWDVQRYQGTTNLAFRDAASIYIGIYGAAAGIPLPMMQSIQNDYAFYKSKFAPGTTMDTTYGSLPAINVTNVQIGYQLVEKGLIH